MREMGDEETSPVVAPQVQQGTGWEGKTELGAGAPREMGYGWVGNRKRSLELDASSHLFIQRF